MHFLIQIIFPGAVRVSAPRPGPHADSGLCPDPRWHLLTVHDHDQRSRVRTTIQGKCKTTLITPPPQPDELSNKILLISNKRIICLTFACVINRPNLGSTKHRIDALKFPQKGSTRLFLCFFNSTFLHFTETVRNRAHRLGRGSFGDWEK